MTTIFPSNPTAEDIYSGYQWNGSAWVLLGVDLSKTYAEVTAGKISSSVIPTTYATTSYTDTAISTAIANLVNSSPTALDTLSELATALGNDANFATTITNALATKITAVPGIIQQFAGSSLPSGWLYCTGQEVAISSYTNLYNALTATGTTFPYGANTNGSGGTGSTHFRIPNLQGRVPVGQDTTQTEFDVLGETGGSKTSVAPHTHSISHDHASFGTTDGAGDHNHVPGGAYETLYIANGHFGTSGPGGSGSWFGASYAPSAGAHNHTIDVPAYSGTSGVASAEATSGNLQPYIVLNYIIKT